MASRRRGTKKAEKKVEEGPTLPDPVLLAGNAMPSEMRTKTYEVAAAAIVARKSEKDRAADIKRALEAAFDGCWHCIVGNSYGVSLATETGCMLFFRIGLTHVLVFRTLDKEAHAQAHADDDQEEDEEGEGDEGDEDLDGGAAAGAGM